MKTTVKRYCPTCSKKDLKSELRATSGGLVHNGKKFIYQEVFECGFCQYMGLLSSSATIAEEKGDFL